MFLKKYLQFCRKNVKLFISQKNKRIPMTYPDYIIEEVRERNDIVDVISSYVDLKQKGNSYVGLCPFHNESTPSFSVNSKKQFYHCFGCGVGGNVYSFIMAQENYDFIESLKYLADRVGYLLPEKSISNKPSFDKEILFEITTQAARFYYGNLLKSELAQNYLKAREIAPKTVKKFGLGYSLDSWDGLYKFLKSKGYSDSNIEKTGLALKNKQGKYYDRFRNRLMFPIFDTRGKVISFGGRTFGDDMPKYLNGPDTLLYNKSNSLYAINFAKQVKNREMIIVEGYMDAIALYQAGFYNVVASLGTSFSEQHSRLLRRFADDIYLVFDSDTAGNTAAMRAIKILYDSGLYAKVVSLKNAKDPDEYIKKFGASDFLQEIKNALNYIDFQIINIKSKFDLDDTQDRIRFTKEVTKILSEIKDPLEKEAYLNQISELTKLSSAAINAQMGIAPSRQSAVKAPKRHTNMQEKALNDAKKNIINLVINSYSAYVVLSEILSPDELVDELSVKLLTLVYQLHKNSDDIYPANLLNYFTEKAEQNRVAEILSVDEQPVDAKMLSQAVNDWVKLIKGTYIDQVRQKTTSLEESQRLLEEKQKLQYLKITDLER